ncbi:hypothetical protein K4G95_22215, partial [Mycobacterium tuberculosis]|nr:hypothetical protein [Mycobacterium tuberculosis]
FAFAGDSTITKKSDIHHPPKRGILSLYFHVSSSSSFSLVSFYMFKGRFCPKEPALIPAIIKILLKQVKSPLLLNIVMRFVKQYLD